MMISRRTVFSGIASLLATHRIYAAESSPPSMLDEAMRGTTTPGMAALVIRNFKTERELVSGVRRLGAPEHVARGDRWHLGSDGKAMTATLIARLVERGILNWESPLEQLLPAMASTMHPSYRDVTLVELLSHRAGLPENHDDLRFFNSFYDDTAALPTQRLRYVATALTDAPVTAKRGEPAYSNTGPLLAAVAAESATQQSFESLIVANVFEPLQIRNVSFDQFGGAHEPAGHVDGRVADRASDANPRMFAPAGGMRMTLRDWARFCIDQMQGESGRGKLLARETYRFLHTGQGDTRSALGWGAAESPMKLKGPALTHAGSDGNWYALVVLFPVTGNGALVVTNSGDSMGGDKVATRAIHALAMTVADAAE
ncbi:MAG: serine hydrolase domain-containing protein [Steroidobacteraceae bacterium]